jgi:hypothetical protein
VGVAHLTIQAAPLESSAKHHLSESIFMSQPPNGLPLYRLLTGPDDAAFCLRVSEALSIGYALFGSPALAFNGERVIAAQAVIWPGVDYSMPGISSTPTR